MAEPVYKRIILKLSGEVLDSPPPNQAYTSMTDFIVSEISEAWVYGVQIAIVIGGGNIFRGISKDKYGVKDRVTADQIGMLATVINALTLKDAFEAKKITSEILTAFEMHAIAKRFTKSRAMKYLEKGKIILLAGGTGNPFFSTDTAAALRALEIEADAIIKGSKVDGIYNKDPMVFSDAVKLDEITYEDALSQNIRVLDPTAFALLKDYKIPIIVCKMNEPGFLSNVIYGKKTGSVVK
jgi:uridylate kinase